MKSMVNRSHIEGFIYEHDLQLRESGANSKHPGTKFIMGNLSIATDNDIREYSGWFLDTECI